MTCAKVGTIWSASRPVRQRPWSRPHGDDRYALVWPRLETTQIVTQRRRFPAIRYWTWAHRLTAAGFLLALLLGQQAGLSWLTGSPTATRWFDVLPFVDPLAGLEVMLASRSATSSLLLGMGTVMCVALLLGRVFCGWLCPLGFLLEMHEQFQVWFSRRILRRRRFRRQVVSRQTKYYVLAFVLIVSVTSGLPVFATFSPINLVILAPMLGMGWGIGLIGVLCVAEFVFPRVFCRALCPLGGLYSLLGRFALLRVRIRPDGQQLMCRQCSCDCPMGISVMEDYVAAEKPFINSGECTRCGTCADACAGQVLAIGVGGKKTRRV